ncbi:DUF1611 domain-containing protein [Microbacterium amylolyticum]|nr:DUF1611 domain-containing protein [Microbacterium amylolyticum]
MVLDGKANNIHVFSGLAEAIAHTGYLPDYLICGVAPADGLLSPAQRVVLLDGISRGMHIINGLHEFLNDDAEFVAASLLTERPRGHGAERVPPACREARTGRSCRRVKRQALRHAACDGSELASTAAMLTRCDAFPPSHSW